MYRHRNVHHHRHYLKKESDGILIKVLALQLGFFAYRRLMGVRRIWRHDFQLSTLPGTTSDQLFFLYYALDHCELSDAVFQSHEFEAHRRLPASVRVNAAVRQFPRFRPRLPLRPRFSHGGPGTRSHSMMAQYIYVNRPVLEQQQQFVFGVVWIMEL
ncbi:hypothetical protein HPB48_004673 [Haemaphysalis longicornis]|uniref:Uncharacterized protein n=1 Tax=Haemaphysalis longicornis TaxID=44386 RepID=A0A9J6FQZ3_HAELO|nr:hypothetical protein HPB48_004673 [Haemaphysalis longicornis]